MSPLRARSPRRRVRPLRIATALVAATLALSGCAMLQHPDATIGGSGVVTDTGSGSDAGTDGGTPSVGAGIACTPAAAQITVQPGVPGATVTIAMERNEFVGSKLTDQTGMSVDTSASLANESDLVTSDGDREAWTARLVDAVRQSTGDIAFGDPAPGQQLAQSLSDEAGAADAGAEGSATRVTVSAIQQTYEVYSIRIACDGDVRSAEVQAPEGAVTRYDYDCAKPELPKGAPHDELLGYCEKSG